jgi:hypothetical protein
MCFNFFLKVTSNLAYLTGKPPKDDFGMLDFLLPQDLPVRQAGATYNPVNRQVRDPYAWWCESLNLSHLAQAGLLD